MKFVRQQISPVNRASPYQGSERVGPWGRTQRKAPNSSPGSTRIGKVLGRNLFTFASLKERGWPRAQKVGERRVGSSRQQTHRGLRGRPGSLKLERNGGNAAWDCVFLELEAWNTVMRRAGRHDHCWRHVSVHDCSRQDRISWWWANTSTHSFLGQWEHTHFFPV